MLGYAVVIISERFGRLVVENGSEIIIGHHFKMPHAQLIACQIDRIAASVDIFSEIEIEPEIQPGSHDSDPSVVNEGGIIALFLSIIEGC